MEALDQQEPSADQPPKQQGPNGEAVNPTDTAKGKDIELKAADEVKTKEAFGNFDKQIKGTGGTMYITTEAEIGTVAKLAWDLSVAKGLPVVVVVRAPRQAG